MIQNEGPSIPLAQIQHMLKPFVQAEGARGNGGTVGLGLSITKMLIEQHQGKINIWSQAGYGTIVGCWLPEGCVDHG